MYKQAATYFPVTHTTLAKINATVYPASAFPFIRLNSVGGSMDLHVFSVTLIGSLDGCWDEGISLVIVEELKHLNITIIVAFFTLGIDHAENALAADGCAACESMPISVLRNRITLSWDGNAASTTLSTPRKKNRRSQRQPEGLDVSEHTPAASPHASFSPAWTPSPVLFAGDQKMGPKL